jgi:hypothetical protein
MRADFSLSGGAPLANNLPFTRNSTFFSKLHAYGLVCTPKYLSTDIDTQLPQVLYTKFSKPFWNRGDFPLADTKDTSYIDPWSQTGVSSTPSDQKFYLILKVAVGGSNEWFEDGRDAKPWDNKSPTAKEDFWNAQRSLVAAVAAEGEREGD